MRKLTPMLFASLLCLLAVPTFARDTLSKPMSQIGRTASMGITAPTPTDRPTIQPAPCGTAGVKQCAPPPPNPIPPPRCIWGSRFCFMPPS